LADNHYQLPPIVVEPYLMSAAGPESWAIDATLIKGVRDAGGYGQGEIIAVCDTGGDTDHPLLAGQYAAPPWSNVPGEDWRDLNNHGRHCAGTAFGNDERISFAPRSKGLTGKCLSNGGSGYDSWIMATMRKSAELKATFISLSIGGGGYNQEFDRLGRELTDLGIVIVVASGNERQQGGQTTYPARYPWALRVGSVNKAGRYSSFSNPGQTADTLTIGFPGENIVSAGPGRSYIQMSGTSMATPGFCGALAAIQSAVVQMGRPRLTAEVFRQLMGGWAKDAGTPGADRDYGPGLFDGELVRRYLNPPPPPLAV
jgi:thermitase